MLSRITKSRFCLVLAIAAMIAAALYQVAGSRAAVDTGTTSVIVELKDDSAAVYKAKTEKAGGSVSNDQLQTYRDGLRANQDQFLAALKNQGVNFSLDSVDIKGFDGNTAATVQYRYTLVLNAVGLTVPQSALSTLQSMPQVKKVDANRYYHVDLSKSVDYIDAPRLYGSNPNDLTSYCVGVPNKEFRLALARPFLSGKINIGVNMMIARGDTGQTVENFATDHRPGYGNNR